MIHFGRIHPAHPLGSRPLAILHGDGNREVPLQRPDKIHGGLTVRWGKAGEQLKLLNGNTISVDDKVGVIADNEAVESLAGIMGGDATSVSDDTRNIYVEAAFWWPEAVQGRSRRFNFSTDAGHRYERGVDPSRTVEIIERIAHHMPANPHNADYLAAKRKRSGHLLA